MTSTPPRKPMTFAVQTAIPAQPAELAPPPKGEKGTKPGASAKAEEGPERQQVGARVTKSVYRQLKSKAALSGETVQTLVERAIIAYLERTR